VRGVRENKNKSKAHHGPGPLQDVRREPHGPSLEHDGLLRFTTATLPDRAVSFQLLLLQLLLLLLSLPLPLALQPPHRRSGIVPPGYEIVAVPELTARHPLPGVEAHEAEGERAQADEADDDRRGRAALREILVLVRGWWRGRAAARLGRGPRGGAGEWGWVGRGGSGHVQDGRGRTSKLLEGGSTHSTPRLEGGRVTGETDDRTDCMVG
jgi:hypothetical protein